MEKRCGTCTKWAKNNQGSERARCSVIGWDTGFDSGKFCTAYQPRGQKTERLHICVMRDEDGDLVAFGDTGGSDEAVEDWMRGEVAATGPVIAWVNADVPLPEEPAVVDGEVSP